MNGRRGTALAALAALAITLAACTPPENEGGTPLPSIRSEAPLNDEGVGPSDDQDEIDENDGD